MEKDERVFWGQTVQAVCPECKGGCVYYVEREVRFYACRTCERLYLVPEREEILPRLRWEAIELVAQGVPTEIRSDWM